MKFTKEFFIEKTSKNCLQEKFWKTIFASRQKYEEDHNDMMHGLVKLILKRFYGAQTRKDVNKSFCCKSEHWMETKYDENVLDYWKLPNGNYFVKIKMTTDSMIIIVILNSLPAHLGSFTLSNSKRFMIISIREINGFYNKNINYSDCDSLYVEKNMEMR